MRGKGTRDLAHCAPNGITPAYAGKSAAALHCADLAWDHPRVCGEKHSSPESLVEDLGSPPRMRGKAAGVRPFRWVVGITPAYAGKRNRGQRRRPATRDHPRVCGEKFPFAPAYDPHAGSPPRMRGKGTAGRVESLSQGITPAYAGKRSADHRTEAGHQDHPRVCGEKGV